MYCRHCSLALSHRFIATSYTVLAMVIDALAPCIARPSATRVLIQDIHPAQSIPLLPWYWPGWLSQNISVSAPDYGNMNLLGILAGRKYFSISFKIPYKKCFCSLAWTKVLLAPGHQGAVSTRKTVLPGMAIPMLKIRRPNGRLIFNMEIAIRR